MFWVVEEYPQDLLELEAQFSTEEACRAYLFQLRWPAGFECPRCGERKAWPASELLWECAGCHRQISVSAVTIFQYSRLPLTLWFRAVWWVTSQKNGVSAMGLQRVLGLKSYKSAWAMLHKLRQAMVRPGRHRLQGRVEMDEAFVGGEEAGVHGQQTDSKAKIPVAVEEDADGIGRIRMRRIPDASAGSLMPFIEESMESGSVVHRGPHRRLAGVSAPQRQRLPAQDRFPEGEQQNGFGADAARSSGGGFAQTLVAGPMSMSATLSQSQLLCWMR